MTAAENAPQAGLHLELTLSRVDGLSPHEILDLRRHELSSAINLLTWRAEQEANGVDGAREAFNEVLDHLRIVATAVGKAKDAAEIEEQRFDRTRPLYLVTNAAMNPNPLADTGSAEIIDQQA